MNVGFLLYRVLNENLLGLILSIYFVYNGLSITC